MIRDTLNFDLDTETDTPPPVNPDPEADKLLEELAFYVDLLGLDWQLKPGLKPCKKLLTNDDFLKEVVIGI